MREKSPALKNHHGSSTTLTMNSDPLADMLTRLRNAALAPLPSAQVPFSNLKLAVAEKLRQVGYLKSVNVKGRKVKKSLELELTYVGKTPKLRGVERISKPSRRVYQQAKEIKLSAPGLALYSTPKGLLTGQEAKKASVGGEVLFKIW